MSETLNETETTIDEQQSVITAQTNKKPKWLTIVILVAIALFAGLVAFYLKTSLSGSKIDYSLIPVQDNSGKWGYINQKGTFVVNPQFSKCFLFSNGVAKVTTSNGKIGYINKKGKFVIPANYLNGTDFHDGFAFVVVEGGRPECINKKGKRVFTLNQAVLVRGFSEGLACFFASNGKCGFVDTKGNIAIPAQFEAADDFSEGLAAIYNSKDKVGFIDKKGRIVISYQFEDASEFSEGLAAFDNGSTVGFVNKKGKYVINPQFEDAEDFSEGLACYDNGDMMGYVDKKGNIVINPQFEVALNFSNGLAAVSSGEKVGYINKKGQYVINPQFDDACSFAGKIAAVNSSGKWGLINKKGKYVVNPMFAYMLSPEDMENIFIQSDYYETKPFVDAFFSIISKSGFDGFTKGATLNDIIKHDVYGDLANTQGTKTVTCESDHALTPDISLHGVSFEFNNAVYENDYDHWDYDSYSYEKKYNMNEPIGCITYNFTLEDDAAEKYGLVAKALQSELSKLYNVQFTEKNGDGRVYYGSGTDFSFVILASYDVMKLFVFPDKKTYDTLLETL